MEARETDKLFRDKLKDAPTAPKADSWEKLTSMLDEQEKAPLFRVWRVAAAVLVLIAFGLVVFLWNDNTQIPDEVAVIRQSSETMQDGNTIVPKEKILEKKDETAEPDKLHEKKELKPKTVRQPKTPVKQKKEKVTKPLEITAPVEIENQQLAQAEIPDSEIEEVTQKKKFKSIKITYKRGSARLPKQEEMIAEQKADTTSGNKIKELWAQTKEISPGDLWADIREAKDNLFQRNSKKNNVKNLNK